MYFYKNKLDVVMGCLLPVAALVGWSDWGFGADTMATSRIVAVLLLLESVWAAWNANDTWGAVLAGWLVRQLVSLVVVICVFMVVGGLGGFFREKKFKQRLELLIVAALGAAGIYVLSRWLPKYIRSMRVTDEPPPLPTESLR